MSSQIETCAATTSLMNAEEKQTDKLIRNLKIMLTYRDMKMALMFFML